MVIPATQHTAQCSKHCRSVIFFVCLGWLIVCLGWLIWIHVHSLLYPLSTADRTPDLSLILAILGILQILSLLGLKPFYYQPSSRVVFCQGTVTVAY